MRVTARGATGAVVDGRVGPGRRVSSARGESVYLEIAQPTRLDAWRRESAGRGAVERRPADPSRDLGPARGMLTAIGLGAAVWMVVIAVVRAVTL